MPSLRPRSAKPLCLPVLASILIAGCGGDGTDAPDVVADYLDFVAAGDAESACELIAQTVPESRYESRCTPPKLSALTDPGISFDELAVKTTFSSDRAQVELFRPDGRPTAAFSLIVEEGDWKLIDQLEALNAPAREQALAAERAIERFGRRNGGSWEGVDVDDLIALEPDLADAQFTISEASESRYVIEVVAVTGATFGMIRDYTGAITYTCSPPGVGGCGNAGSWKRVKYPPGF